MPATPFFYRESFGIRVTVRPMYLRDQSEPSQQHYVFAYFVRIENVGARVAQLISRRWLIHDSSGEDIEVKGEGVVGEQPVIEPGGASRVPELLHPQVGRGLHGGALQFCHSGGHHVPGRDPALHPERQPIDEPSIVTAPRERQLPLSLAT